MPRSRWETHIEPFLTEIAGMARDGVIDKDIAKALDVSYSTFRKYIKEKPELAKIVKPGKDYIDRKVEEGLINRARGCTVRKVIKEPYLDPETGHMAQDEDGNLKLRVTKVIEEEMAPETRAAIFWLKNRKPEEYRDKHEIEHKGEIRSGKLDDIIAQTGGEGLEE